MACPSAPSSTSTPQREVDRENYLLRRRLGIVRVHHVGPQQGNTICQHGRGCAGRTRRWCFLDPVRPVPFPCVTKSAACPASNSIIELVSQINLCPVSMSLRLSSGISALAIIRPLVKLSLGGNCLVKIVPLGLQLRKKVSATSAAPAANEDCDNHSAQEATARLTLTTKDGG